MRRRVVDDYNKSINLMVSTVMVVVE